MGECNFDMISNRSHADYLKYDGYQCIYGASDLVPLWVADMDFPTPNFVFDAINERQKDSFLGYFIHTESYYQSIIGWMQRRYGWIVNKDWIYPATGVMPSLFFLVQAFSEQGDKILIQPPVYSPFYSVIENQKRVLVKNPLKLIEDHYEMDFDHLEDCLRGGVKMMILCNPHNPIGKSWSKEVLGVLGELCLKYRCIIVSDEAHSDIIMPNYTHTPIANVSNEIAQNTITCMSPSKAFNLAGLSTSEIIIPNRTMRLQFETFKQGIHLFGGNVFGEIALMACYNNGEEWLRGLLKYISENVEFMQHNLQTFIPGIKYYQHEATYLAWLDFSSLGMSHEEISRLLIKEAKLALSDGLAFGVEGEKHFRINIACQRSVLSSALEKLIETFR